LIDIIPAEDQEISLEDPPPEYIFIHSHRRSGTHLLIDTISSWFDVVPGFCHFPTLDDTFPQGDASILPDIRLIKSHEPIYGFQLNAKHLWTSQQHLDENRRLYENSPHIYIVRNPFLVLRSLYVFDLMGTEEKFKIEGNLSFRDYLLAKSMHELNKDEMNRIKYWKQHVLNWASRSDVLIIDYEDLLQSTASTVEAISQHVRCLTRSSQRSINPTGIGRGLTDRFLKGGREPVWEPDITILMETTIEHLAVVQPRMEPLVDRWLSAARSGFRGSDPTTTISPADNSNSEIQGTEC
jgi:Sulfotransferase domain